MIIRRRIFNKVLLSKCFHTTHNLAKARGILNTWHCKFSSQNNLLDIPYNKFKDGELVILKATRKQQLLFCFSSLMYIVLLVFLFKTIKKALTTSEDKAIKRIFKAVSSAVVIFFILIRAQLKYSLSKLVIKHISLLPDGRRIKISYFYPSEKVFDISNFKKLSKEEILSLPKSFFIISKNEGYLVKAGNDVNLILKNTLILEKDVLSEIASSQYINIKI